MNKQTKWFIAGSKALQKERDLCRVIFGKMQNKWNQTFIVKTFEDFPTSITNDTYGRQSDYNSYIKNEADGIIFIFDNHAGGITIDEFLLAYHTFIAKGNPKIYIYCCKNQEKINPEIDKLKELLTSLHQYYIEYNDIEELRSLISNDIDNYIIEHTKIKSEPQIKHLNSEVKLFGSTIAIILFLLCFSFICWISAKTLNRAINLPIFIAFICNMGFLLLMILFQKRIFNNLFTTYSKKTKFNILFPYILLFSSYGSVIIPCCAHYFFYEDNILNIIQSDIKTTEAYYKQTKLINENDIEILEHINKEITIAKYENKFNQNIPMLIERSDSILLVYYNKIKSESNDIRFSNEIDEYIYTKEILQTANQRIKNIFSISKEYNLMYYEEYKSDFTVYLLISFIITFVPYLCLFLLQQYHTKIFKYNFSPQQQKSD